MWVPADLGGENQSWTAHNYAAVARLKNGVTLEQASHDISAIARRIYEGSSEKGEYLLGRGIVSLSKAGKDVSMRRWGPKWPGRGHAGTLAWLVEGLEGSEASHR